MANTLTITKNYSEDGTVNSINESKLDAFIQSIETFFNTTGINSDNLSSEAIVASNLSANSVIEAKILNSNVTTAKLNDGAVTGPKLNDNAVDDSSIELSSNTLQLKDGGVTQAKLEAMTVTTDGSDPDAGGLSSNSSNSLTTETSITTLGNPVIIKVIPKDGSEILLFDLVSTAIYRDTTKIADYRGNLSSSNLTHVDNVGEGTYEYKIEFGFNPLIPFWVINNVRIVAYEL